MNPVAQRRAPSKSIHTLLGYRANSIELIEQQDNKEAVDQSEMLRRAPFERSPTISALPTLEETLIWSSGLLVPGCIYTLLTVIIM